MKQREVAAPGLVVASTDGSESLERMKANLDEIADSIELAIQRQSSFALGLGVDHRLEATRANLADELVGVVASIGYESSAMGVIEKFSSGDHLMPLARGQCDVERPAFRVDDRVDLG